MIRLYIRNAVLLTAVTAVAYGLTAEFGPWPAFLTCAAVSAVACVAGAILLRTSGVGRVTWRNRLAGYLIPWGWRLNRGKLWPLPVISWAVWTAVCGVAALLRPVPDQPSLGVRSALLAAWVIDAAAIVYLLGTIAQATPGNATDDSLFQHPARAHTRGSASRPSRRCTCPSSGRTPGVRQRLQHCWQVSITSTISPVPL